MQFRDGRTGDSDWMDPGIWECFGVAGNLWLAAAQHWYHSDGAGIRIQAVKNIWYADLASNQLKGETEERKAAYEWAMSYQNSSLSSLGFGPERIKRSALELTEKLNPENWDQVSMESNMQLTWNTCSHVIWKTYWSQYPRVICDANRDVTHPTPIETRRNQSNLKNKVPGPWLRIQYFVVSRPTDVLGLG